MDGSKADSTDPEDGGDGQDGALTADAEADGGGLDAGSVAGDGGTDAATAPRDRATSRTVVQAGVLQYVVTGTEGPVVPGGRVQLEVMVSNTANREVAGVSLLLRVPAGFSFNYTNAADPDSSYCGNGVCSENEEATWALGTIAAGASRSVFVVLDAGTSLADGEALSAGFRLSATGISPPILDKPITVAAAPATELSLGSTHDQVRPGESFWYVLQLGHIGPSALTGTKLTLALPNQVDVEQLSDGGSVNDDGVVVWDIGAFSVGDVLERRVRVSVVSDGAAGDLLPAHAEFVRAGGAVDSTGEHLVALPSSALTLHADLTADTSPIVPGRTARLSLTIANLANRAQEGVTAVMRVPEGITFNYTSSSEPDSSYCGNGVCSVGEEPTWTIGTLAAGASQRIDLELGTLPESLGDGDIVPFELTVHGTNTPDLRVVRAVPVHTANAVELAVSTPTDPVVPGQAVTLDFDLGQVGASAVSGTELRAVLPAGLVVTSVSDGGSNTAGEVAWTVGDLAVGAQAHRTIQASVAADAVPGALLTTEVKLVHAGGLAIDAQAEHTLSVVSAAPSLSMTVASSPASLTPGARVLYTVTITNNASRGLDDGMLLLRLPRGVQFAYATDAQPDSSYCGNGVCSQGEEASWALGTIAAGATQIVTINAQTANTLLAGSLIASSFRLTGGGFPAPVYVGEITHTRP